MRSDLEEDWRIKRAVSDPVGMRALKIFLSGKLADFSLNVIVGATIS